EGGSGAGGAAEVDAAAVVFHDLVREGQSQPGAAVLRGEERVEDAVGGARTDALAAVGDLDAHAARAGRGMAPRQRGAAIGPADPQRETPAGRHGVERVADE